MAIQMTNNVGSYSAFSPSSRCGCRFVSALEVGGPVLLVMLCDVHEAAARMEGKPLNTIDDLAAVYRANMAADLKKAMGGL